jgi:hypothetical protein
MPHESQVSWPHGVVDERPRCLSDLLISNQNVPPLGREREDARRVAALRP